MKAPKSSARIRSREVLDVVYWADNSRSLRCSAAGEPGKCGEYVPKFSLVRESGAHYWALHVEEQGVKPDLSGAVLTTRGHYRYRFDGVYFSRVDADS